MKKLSATRKLVVGVVGMTAGLATTALTSDLLYGLTPQPLKPMAKAGRHMAVWALSGIAGKAGSSYATDATVELFESVDEFTEAFNKAKKEIHEARKGQ